MSYDGIVKITCSKCDAVHDVPYKDFPDRDRGSIDCVNCGHELHRWKNTREFYSPSLSDTISNKGEE